MLVPVFVALVKDQTKVTLNIEHTGYQWCSIGEAKALAPFSNQHALYDFIGKHFLDNSPPAHLRIF